jgi:hypothetical protein
MNLRCCTLLAVVCCSCSLFAQQATIFSFLRGSISARTAGVGGSNTAQNNDVSIVAINPASLVTLDSNAVSATFLKQVLDLNAGFITYGWDAGELGTMAVTAHVMSYGSFPRTNNQGAVTGSFSVADVVAGVTLAREIDTLISYGITLKAFHSAAEEQRSTALALDGSLHFQFPKQRTSLAVSVLNVGTQLSTYDGTSDRLPVDARIGVQHKLRGLPLTVNASLTGLADRVETFTDRLLNFSVGGELSVGKYVFLRVGYDNATRNTSNVDVTTQLTGLSGGIGVVAKSVFVDYALSTFGSAAIVHRISVSMGL